MCPSIGALDESYVTGLKAIMLSEKEDRTMMNIERHRLPDGAREGDVLVIDQNRIFVDEEGTEARRLKIEKMVESLWE